MFISFSPIAGYEFMSFGYNERRKSNLTIIFSALLIPSRIADLMLLDGLLTTRDSLSQVARARTVLAGSIRKRRVNGNNTKGIERDEISDVRGSVGDLDVGRVTRFEQ